MNIQRCNGDFSLHEELLTLLLRYNSHVEHKNEAALFHRWSHEHDNG